MVSNTASRRNVLKAIGVTGATLTFAGFATASDGQARYIAKANGNATDAIESAGFEVLTELAAGNVVLVKGPEDASDDLAAAGGVSTALPDVAVEFAEPAIEDVSPEAPETVDQVYEEYLWDKQIQQVREAHEYATGADQTIAVIDTGIDDTHPDLDVDVDRSVAIVDGQPAPHTGDEGGHGTHVAGTAAGTGEELMLGTAPDATLVSVRVLYGDSGTFGDIMAGMAYAGQVEADAANISLGFMVPPEHEDFTVGAYQQMFEPVANRVTRDGTLLVGSGGNDETDLQGGWLRLWNGLAGVLGVSATAPNDELAFYSNYGTNDIDVGAPGGGYETLEKTLIEDPDEVEWPYPLNLVFSAIPDGYGWKAGTSMAAPQVTGLAALVWELDPDANARQVEQAIKHGAEGTNGRGDPELGAGRTNALHTVERIADTGNSGRNNGR